MHLMSRKREPMDWAILGFFSRTPSQAKRHSSPTRWPHAKSFRVSRSRPQVPARISSIWT